MARLRILKNGREIKSLEFLDSEEIIGGRSDTCQVFLDDESISRQHFKIYKSDQGWVVEKLSKFGVLYYGDQMVSSQLLLDSDVFTIPPFTINFEAMQQAEVQLSTTPEQPIVASEAVPVEIAVNDDQTMDIADRTSTEGMRAVPYLTITDSSGEELLRLEGVAWLIGREEHCEIQISDPRSSRKHIKLFKSNGQFFVQDLGSSNGTLLNGQTLSGEAVQLESGDRFQIGDTVFLFEQRDPMYDQAVQNLPVDVNPPSQQQPGVVYLPVQIDLNRSIEAANGGGALRLDLQPAPDKAARAKKFRFVLVGAIVLILAFVFLSEEDTGKKESASKGTVKSKDPFDSLTPQEQEMVKRTFNLAKNLYMQTKYELALAEIRKIHEKIPSYLESKEIEGLAQSALQSIANRKYEEEIERKQKEALENAKKIVADCTKKYFKSTDISAVEGCLAPALEIDPENSSARKLIETARALIEQKNLQKTNRAEYLRRVRTREEIYQQARALQSQGKLLDAVDVYERHIASTLPDPKNLEGESHKGVQEIKSDIQKILSSATTEAEGHVANAEYRDAILKLERALDLDPSNAKARELYDTASKELFKKMKALFSDSVVEESLGNVESAKVKWKKIVEQDIPKGEYRAKATIKLKKYGE